MARARALIWRSAKTLLYRAPFSLLRLVPQSNFLKSADSITGTSGARRDGLFSDRKGVSPHLESIPFRKDSAQVGRAVSPTPLLHQTWTRASRTPRPEHASIQ